MDKNKNKTHSKFHCDQVNGSWFKLGGTMVEGNEIVEGGEEHEPIP